MDETQRHYIEEIRLEYKQASAGKKDERIEELKNLERLVEIPPRLIGFLVLLAGIAFFAIGLCYSLGVFGSNFVLGVVFGVLGILFVLLTYPLTRWLLERRKKRYAERILALTDAILEKDE